MHLVLLISDSLRLKRVMDRKAVDALGYLFSSVGQVAILFDSEAGLGAGDGTVVEVDFGGLFLYGEGHEVTEGGEGEGLGVEDELGEHLSGEGGGKGGV
jgi:hypothetical protein